jgi:prepilin-type N-terminal cleavage/methylation domain-containing protein
MTHTTSLNLRNKKAFTLVETLVAITILSLSVAGPLYTASQATVMTNATHDRVTAAYLAQEAVEHVRMMRDSAFLVNATTGWSTFVSAMSTCSTSCILDPYPYPGTLQACVGASCTPLYTESNRYRQGTATGGTLTPFTRTITYDGATNAVTVTVAWTNRSTAYSVRIVEQFQPWQ